MPLCKTAYAEAYCNNTYDFGAQMVPKWCPNGAQVVLKWKHISWVLDHELTMQCVA